MSICIALLKERSFFYLTHTKRILWKGIKFYRANLHLLSHG